MVTRMLFDRTYTYSIETGKFLINGCDGSETNGQSFYKYYALNENSVDALKHLYVYATHPNQFNDPFDCDKDIINFDDIEAARVLWEDLDSEVEEFCGDNKAFLEFTNFNYKTVLYKKIGILSLSQQNDNIAMWAHYTNHKGFCLEFDIHSFPFEKRGPFQINYQDCIKPISINQNTLQIATLVQTNVKQVCWRYENEWRLLIECNPNFLMTSFGDFSENLKRPDDHNRKFYYPLKCLRSITLGLQFFDGMKEIINSSLYYESEIITTNKLQQQVLDFISFSKIPAYLLLKDGLAVKRQMISISKLTSNTFRFFY